MAGKKVPKSMTLQEMRDDAEMRLKQGMDPDAEVVILGNGHTARIIATTPIRGKLHLHRSNERNCDRFAKGMDAVRAFADEIGETLNGPEDVFANFRNFVDWLYKKPSKRRAKKGAK